VSGTGEDRVDVRIQSDVERELGATVCRDDRTL
jgi:hypothetical protein